jgi:hypothetical protein
MANSVTIEGGIGPNHEKGTNRVWAFTGGELTNTGWDSEKANNVSDIIRTTRDQVKATGLVTLAVPRWGGKQTEDFTFDKLIDDNLRLYLFYDGDTPIARTTLVFPGIKVRNSTPHRWTYKAQMLASYTQVTLTVSGDVMVSETYY